MIDLQLLRKSPDDVAKRLASRGGAQFDAAEFQVGSPGTELEFAL